MLTSSLSAVTCALTLTLIACGPREDKPSTIYDNSRLVEATDTMPVLDDRPVNDTLILETPPAFIESAISDGMMEIEMADLVIKRSGNTRIDSIAAMIKSGHQKANAELKALALKKKWTVPSAMLDQHRAMLQELRDTDNDKLERMYLDMMADAHVKAIQRFERMALTDFDPDLKDWASKTLPALKAHMEEVQRALSAQ
jgi:putative membrane protein